MLDGVGLGGYSFKFKHLCVCSYIQLLVVFVSISICASGWKIVRRACLNLTHEMKTARRGTGCGTTRSRIVINLFNLFMLYNIRYAADV